MNINTIIGVFSLLCLGLGPSSQVVAQTVAAPDGWSETARGNSRILMNGTTTIEVGPLQKLDGQSIEAWISGFRNMGPEGMSLISVDRAKADRVPGTYALLRHVKFEGEKGISILYACPGPDNTARLLRMDVHMSRQDHMKAGVSFGEAVCNAGGQQVAAVGKMTGDGNDRNLAALNAKIPKANKPVSASIVTGSELGFGFPAPLLITVEMEAEFPNGYYTTCLDWNPIQTSSPTPNTIGRGDPDCSLSKTKNGSGKVKGFKAGQRLDLKLGNVSAGGIDGITSSTSWLSGKKLVFTKDGRIAMNSWGAFSTSVPGASATGGSNSKGLAGRYYLNGYTLTIAADTGEVVHGFIGYTSSSGNSVDSIYLNGERYWDR